MKTKLSVRISFLKFLNIFFEESVKKKLHIVDFIDVLCDGLTFFNRQFGMYSAVVQWLMATNTQWMDHKRGPMDKRLRNLACTCNIHKMLLLQQVTHKTIQHYRESLQS